MSQNKIPQKKSSKLFICGYTQVSFSPQFPSSQLLCSESWHLLYNFFSYKFVPCHFSNFKGQTFKFWNTAKKFSLHSFAMKMNFTFESLLIFWRGIYDFQFWDSFLCANFHYKVLYRKWIQDGSLFKRNLEISKYFSHINTTSKAKYFKIMLKPICSGWCKTRVTYSQR